MMLLLVCLMMAVIKFVTRFIVSLRRGNKKLQVWSRLNLICFDLIMRNKSSHVIQLLAVPDVNSLLPRLEYVIKTKAGLVN